MRRVIWRLREVSLEARLQACLVIYMDDAKATVQENGRGGTAVRVYLWDTLTGR